MLSLSMKKTVATERGIPLQGNHHREEKAGNNTQRIKNFQKERADDNLRPQKRNHS
ncbi:hypothetical protein MD535_23720 [Vibrio sp. ZSDZ65]|uniref:Uncharacterized protein n=1 Tax=Vibrio qingdaonensis TaxID=2829491 RepID=A0A9X3CV31_9VIBR|nr:hypothetical protein [Vibrio qingdaonensis]MCW8349005.1 hypothetical protein [Vibrio qingdaonensis]